LTQGQGVDEYIKEFVALSSVVSDLTDANKACMFIKGLNTVTRNQVESNPLNLASLDKAINAAKIHSLTAQKGSEKALAVQASSAGRLGPFCWGCRKPGHIAANCPRSNFRPRRGRRNFRPGKRFRDGLKEENREPPREESSKEDEEHGARLAL
jgi:hypothetical protein